MFKENSIPYQVIEKERIDSDVIEKDSFQLDRTENPHVLHETVSGIQEEFSTRIAEIIERVGPPPQATYEMAGWMQQVAFYSEEALSSLSPLFGFEEKMTSVLTDFRESLFKLPSLLRSEFIIQEKIALDVPKEGFPENGNPDNYYAHHFYNSCVWQRKALPYMIMAQEYPEILGENGDGREGGMLEGSMDALRKSYFPEKDMKDDRLAQNFIGGLLGCAQVAHDLITDPALMEKYPGAQLVYAPPVLDAFFATDLLLLSEGMYYPIQVKSYFMPNESDRGTRTSIGTAEEMREVKRKLPKPMDEMFKFEKDTVKMHEGFEHLQRPANNDPSWRKLEIRVLFAYTPRSPKNKGISLSKEEIEGGLV